MTSSTVTSQKTSKTTKNLCSSASDSLVQRSILDFTRPNDSGSDKSVEILTLLQDIKSSVSEHRSETKSYAAVLTEIRDKTAKSASSHVSDIFGPSTKPTFSTISMSTTAANADRNFPPLSGLKRKRLPNSTSSFTPKRSRTDPKIVAQKTSFGGRVLKSGTGVKQNHGLGSPPKSGQKLRRSEDDRFKKSLYVSKLKPSVTVQSITDYVKGNVPGISDDMFSMRLLVKKGQNLDDLNFISFRLNCDDDLFIRLSDPSFWPAHVMIGEFVEKNKSKNISFGDFFVKVPTPTPDQTSSAVTAPAPSPAVPLSEPPRMETDQVTLTDLPE